MPSHTFTRVGHWEDSIDTNRASADAARKANSAAEVLHAFDYQVYAYLQTAQDAAAQKVMGELKATTAAVNTAEQHGTGGLLRRRRDPGATRWSAAPGRKRRRCPPGSPPTSGSSTR